MKCGGTLVYFHRVLIVRLTQFLFTEILKNVQTPLRPRRIRSLDSGSYEIHKGAVLLTGCLAVLKNICLHFIANNWYTDEKASEGFECDQLEESGNEDEENSNSKFGIKWQKNKGGDEEFSIQWNVKLLWKVLYVLRDVKGCENTLEGVQCVWRFIKRCRPSF